MTEGSHARGYVLARRPVGELEHFFDALLHDGTLRECVARTGGARVGAALSAALQPFSLVRMTLGRTNRSGVTRVLEASVERAHPGLLSGLHRLSAASVVGVLTRELSGGFSEDAAPFEHFAAALEALEAATPAQCGGVLVRYALDALERGGSPLTLDACVRCGRAAPEGALVRVSIDDGGVVCGACGGGALSLRASARRALAAVRGGDDARFVGSMLPWLAAVLSRNAPRAAVALRSTAPHWGPRAHEPLPRGGLR